MVWSLVFVLIVLAVLRRWSWLGDVRRSPALLGKFAVSALLLAGNWLSYVWAVNDGHVLDASLGYFILPLINVALGFIFCTSGPARRSGRPLPWPPPACCGWRCNRAMCPGWRC